MVVLVAIVMMVVKMVMVVDNDDLFLFVSDGEVYI